MKIFPLTHEELLICERLRSLRMSGMADAFESQMLDPNADLAPFIERFTEIVNHEWQIRYDKKFKRYLKQAHLRYPDADLDEPFMILQENWTQMQLSGWQPAIGLMKERIS